MAGQSARLCTARSPHPLHLESILIARESSPGTLNSLDPVASRERSFRRPVRMTEPGDVKMRRWKLQGQTTEGHSTGVEDWALRPRMFLAMCRNPEWTSPRRAAKTRCMAAMLEIFSIKF